MKLLFVTDNTFQETSAVFNICRSLAELAVEQGHSVAVLGNTSRKDAPLDETKNGVVYHRFYDSVNGSKRELWETRKTNRIAFLMGVLRSPGVLISGLARVALGYNPIALSYKRHIERYCKNVPPDAVVAFTAPYYTAIALSMASLEGVKKIVYMMDPYSTHSELGGSRASRIERRVLGRADHAFIAHSIYAEYRDKGNDMPLNKIIPVSFPCLGKKQISKVGDMLPKDRINCVYCGSFYPDIRTPKYLYELLSGLNMPELHVTLIGDSKRLHDAEIQRFQDDLIREGKITVYPQQTPAVAYGAMEDADILINIGNRTENMLPSKLFDYLSTGKPILNIRPKIDHLSAECLSRYPLVLDICEDDSPMEKQAGEMKAFCRSNSGKQMPFDDVAALYRECTPEYALELLLEHCT